MADGAADTLALAFKLPPRDALAYMQAKGYALSWNWFDLDAAAHSRAFTVAKVTSLDVLEDIRGAFQAHLQRGGTGASFIRELEPILKAKGWWGRLPMLDEQGQPMFDADGRPRTYQAGSLHRLDTIFRTNKMVAYNAGRWRAFDAARKLRPWLQYIAVDDDRVRQSHKALNGLVFHIDDPFWDSHTPPNGWNCRCRIRSLSDRDIDRLGLQNKVTTSAGKLSPVQQICGIDPYTGEQVTCPGVKFDLGIGPEGEVLPDPGWSTNPGRTGAAVVNRLLKEKAEAAAAEAAKIKTAQAAAAKAAMLALAKEAGEAALARSMQNVAARQAAAQAAAAKLAAQAKAKAAVAAAQQQLAKEAGEAALARAQAKVAQRAAGSQLAGIAGGPSGGKNAYPKKALKELEQDPAFTALAPAEQLAAVKAKAAELAEAAKIKAGLTNYQKFVLDGKQPTAAQKAALAKLPQAEQDQFLQDLAAAKAAKDAAEAAAAAAAAQVPAAPPMAALNFADLEQIGGQGGSNPGGLFRHKVTGEKWYVKVPGNPDQARNEVLTAQLYRAAGVEAPEYAFLTVTGQIGGGQYSGAFGIASKIIDGLTNDAAALRAGSVAGVREGFALDAWLANWDVVGLNFDNLLVRAGRAVRVDTGGGLLYRAQGAPKGPAFGPRVLELDSLRDPNINPQAAAVFRHVTDADLRAGVARILAIPDADIRRLVDQYGPGDAATRQALADTLIARKRDLAARYPTAPAAPTPAPGARALLSPDEQLRIDAARVNGYARPTDGDQIEDQNLLLWRETSAAGTPQSRAYLKLRGDAERALAAEIAAASGAMPHDGNTFDRLLEALRGIASNFAAGNPLRQIDLDRVQAAQTAYADRYRQLLAQDPALAASFRAQFDPYVGALTRAIAPGVGQRADWAPPPGQLDRWSPPPLAAAAGPGGRTWTRQSGTFEAADLRNGHAVRNGQIGATVGEKYVTTLADGTRIEYWPDEPGIPWAVRRRLEVTAPGADPERPLTALAELGIDTSRAGPLQREDLYLRRIAYHRRDFDLVAAAEAEPDLTKRVADLKNALTARIGRDITRTGAYLPDGEHQAFGHGRNVQFRPDLEGDPEWDRFQRDYRLHHQLTQGDIATSLARIINGGGQMAPTTDKLRRGIPMGGMSPAQDLATGGASYFFTRIKAAADAWRSPGLIWKANKVARLDAISYDRDLYGETTAGFVEANRKTGVAEWRAAATKGGNETIFKDSLSLFDDLEHIVAGSPAERDAIIDLFRQAGYATWPDGRPLTDVVVLPR